MHQGSAHLFLLQFGMPDGIHVHNKDFRRGTHLGDWHLVYILEANVKSEIRFSRCHHGCPHRGLLPVHNSGLPDDGSLGFWRSRVGEIVFIGFHSDELAPLPLSKSVGAKADGLPVPFIIGSRLKPLGCLKASMESRPGVNGTGFVTDYINR
jgi:hypothetical protein